MPHHRLTPRRRRSRAAIAITGLGLALAFSTGNAAIAVTSTVTGSISGVITHAGNGSADPDACALVYAASDINNPVAGGCADATGHYSVSGLVSGQYEVEFLDSTESGGHDVARWYHDAADGQSGNFVAVSGSNTTANINQALASGGWISGTVTNAVDHTPLHTCDLIAFTADDRVQAGQYAVVNDSGDGTSSAYSYVNVCTDEDGHYSTAGLAAGNYVLQYDIDGVNGAEHWSDPIAVTAGAAGPYPRILDTGCDYAAGCSVAVPAAVS